MAIDLTELHKQAQKEKEGDFYKLKEGANRMRILTQFEKVETIYRGNKYAGIVSDFNQPKEDDKVTWRAWAWAIIRGQKPEDDELKIVQLSRAALNQIAALKVDPEYAFEGYPIPYDLTLNAKNAGTKDVEYSVVPARANTEVTEAEMAALNKEKSIPDIIAKMVDKQAGKGGEQAVEYPEESIKPEDIPF